MEKFDWEVVERYVDKIVDQINNLDFKFDAVFGVANGGLIPAAMIAYKLGVPVETIEVAPLDKEFWLTAPWNILIVDDVVDHGDTMNTITHNNSINCHVACLVSKPYTDYKANFVGYETENWVWFPWEAKEAAHNVCKRTRELL